MRRKSERASRGEDKGYEQRSGGETAWTASRGPTGYSSHLPCSLLTRTKVKSRTESAGCRVQGVGFRVQGIRRARAGLQGRDGMQQQAGERSKRPTARLRNGAAAGPRRSADVAAAPRPRSHLLLLYAQPCRQGTDHPRRRQLAVHLRSGVEQVRATGGLVSKRRRRWRGRVRAWFR